jgi:2-polyprenyl-3-methyl-5-hydroxy-6-metoxy-1,4-benzoquinol methylase
MVALLSRQYNRRYFEWQKIGDHFGAWPDIHKFRNFIERMDSVVDFGCGGEFMLAAPTCHRRLDIEVNSVSQEHCRQLGLTVVSDLAAVELAWTDVVISNHALEHTLNLYHELREVYRMRKSGGMAFFVVLCERHDTTFKKDRQSSGSLRGV